MATGLPSGFLDGVRHFNAGRYFEAHEAFEELLDSVEEDARWDLLKGLIKVAVGYHKAAARHAGAQRMLGLGLDALEGFPDVSYGFELGKLRARVGEDLQAVGRGATWAQRLAGDPPRMRLTAARALRPGSTARRGARVGSGRTQGDPT